ncbi:hypothetical protein B0H11DRAFT_2065078 [Mycena galericulata]|nr:hypothetical protein B0H11DRAFT_2065078 [Mycena galericulata]
MEEQEQEQEDEEVQEQEQEPEVDEEAEEAARRQRVAERMARMGGVNPLGARPSPPPRKATADADAAAASPPAPSFEHDEAHAHEQPEHGDAQAAEGGEKEEEKAEDDEEEEEAARKRRVMERMAKMGGFNPFAAQPVPGPRPVHRESAQSAKSTGSGSGSIPPNAADDDDATQAGIPRDELHEEPEEYEDAGEQQEEEVPHAIPPPPRAVPPPALRESEEETESGYEMEEEEAPPPPPARVEHRRSIPPPRAVPVPLPADELEDDDEEYAPPPPPRPTMEHRRSIPPPPRAAPAPVADELEQEEEAPPPPPRPATEHRRSIPPPPRAIPAPVLPPAPPSLRESEEETESAYEVEEQEEAMPPPPPPRTHARPPPTHRSIPPPPPPPEAREESGQEQEQDDADAVEVPPPLPRGRRSTHPSPPAPAESATPLARGVPLPPAAPASEDDYEQLETPEIGAFEHISAPVPLSREELTRTAPHRPSAIQIAGKQPASPAGLLSPNSAAFELKRAQEILDEEEGDPIDPAFHSPSRRTSTIELPAVAPAPEPEPEVESAEPVEDPETVRRRTIAERMAKLGGIKFGAAPLPRARAPQASEDDQGSAPPAEHEAAEEQPQDEEEEERARRERIAAKLAGMGGMRIGMMPFGAGGLPPQQSKALGGPSPPPPPPARAVPPSRAPPPPQPQEVDSEHESMTTNSEDGVRVEAEESEIEEIRHEDAEEVPPPVPTRSGHRTSIPAQAPSDPGRRTSQPLVPAGRPPVPSTMPQSRRASTQMGAAPTSRKSSADTPPVPGGNNSRQSSVLSKSQTQEFVMVESDESPPPPPARPVSRPPPPRNVPPPPPPGAFVPSDSVDSMASSQWELPSIPSSSIDFGGGIDTSFSLVGAAPSAKPHPQSSQQPPPIKSPEVQYTSDDLVAVWGRVGVHLCEAATQLYEKSKKSLVGDGTYSGFVNAALSEVPNAARSPPPVWGHLVYAQSAGSVQKRLSDIMPGDIVALFDAKLKGHKGLAAYSQTVGAGEPLVGIVSEFEPKKSKIRVFQANQHVGHQTVEAVSYRLEDLKSGIVKVYRVLEA